MMVNGLNGANLNGAKMDSVMSILKCQTCLLAKKTDVISI